MALCFIRASASVKKCVKTSMFCIRNSSNLLQRGEAKPDNPSVIRKICLDLHFKVRTNIRKDLVHKCSKKNRSKIIN